MPILTVRPDHTVHTGLLSVVGASSAHAALTDDSDSSYVQGDMGAPALYDPGNHVYLHLQPIVLPSGADVTAVRVRTRSRGTGTRVRRQWRRASTGATLGTTGGAVTLDDDWGERLLPWSSGSPVGAARDDDLALGLFHTGIAGQGPYDARTAELWVDVEYSTPPTVTIDAPAEHAEVEDTTRPTIAWTFDDPDGERGQAAYRAWVRDPAGSIVYETGYVESSTDREVQVDVDLDPVGTWTVELQVAKQLDSGRTQWSPVASHTFHTAVASGPAPAATAARMTGDPRVLIGVELDTDSLPDGATDPRVHLAYRDDDGRTRPVRGADGLPWPEGLHTWGDEVATWGDLHVSWGGMPGRMDYEAPMYRGRTYLAWVSFDLDGQRQITARTTVEVEPAPARADAWITDVLDPEALHARVHPLSDRVRTWQGREVVHTPAGRRYPTVESELPTVSDDVSLYAIDPPSHDTLASMFADAGRVLLYRDDRREHFYFVWTGDRTRTQVGAQAFDADVFAGSMVEVARPDVEA